MKPTMRFAQFKPTVALRCSRATGQTIPPKLAPDTTTPVARPRRFVNHVPVIVRPGSKLHIGKITKERGKCPDNQQYIRHRENIQAKDKKDSYEQLSPRPKSTPVDE